MFGISKKAAKYTWSAAIVILMLALVYRIRSTLFVFVLALLFAYLLSPLVRFLDRWLPGDTVRGQVRGVALALAYLIFIGAVVLMGAQIGSRVVDQAQTLAKRFPDMLAKWQNPTEGAPQGVNDLKVQIVTNLRNEIGQRANDILHALPAAGVKLMSIASDLVFIVVVPILAFFFLKDGAAIRCHILETFNSPKWRARIDTLLQDIHVLLAQYMRALVLLSLATFTSYSVFFLIMGVPFGVLLAVVAMFLEFIPMIGPLTAWAIILIVTAVSGGHFLAVFGFLAAYRLFQDYVLSPHLMGQGVELHPLLVLFGVFAGAEVAGVAGSFLSVPMLALARVVYLHVRRSRLTTGSTPPTLVTNTTLVGQSER